MLLNFNGRVPAKPVPSGFQPTAAINRVNAMTSQDTLTFGKARVVTASNAWKGSVSSAQVNAAIGEAIRQQAPDADIQAFPVADGGDGTLETIRAANPKAYQTETLQVTGPLPTQKVAATALTRRDDNGQVCEVLLECADIHGLRRLPAETPEYLKPLETTSYGTGEAFNQLRRKYPKARFVFSLGGSATVDGGAPFLQALGWRFFDAAGQELGKTPAGETQPMIGGDLERVATIHPPAEEPNFPEVTVLYDVHTRFMDAPNIFGPQKGAGKSELDILNRGFSQFKQALENRDPRQAAFIETLKGSGAAGGMGLALKLSSPAKVSLVPGMDYTMRVTGLDKAIDTLAQTKNGDFPLLITGEGGFNNTSSLGKGPGRLIEIAQAKGIPVAVVCGKDESGQEGSSPSAAREGVTILPLCPTDYAVSEAEKTVAVTQRNIRQLIERQWADLSEKARRFWGKSSAS